MIPETSSMRVTALVTMQDSQDVAREGDPSKDQGRVTSGGTRKERGNRPSFSLLKRQIYSDIHPTAAS